MSPNVTLMSDDSALEYLDICLANGYEGAVTRQYEPEYAFGQRPMFMRKLKKFDDAEIARLRVTVAQWDLNEP